MSDAITRARDCVSCLKLASGMRNFLIDSSWPRFGTEISTDRRCRYMWRLNCVIDVTTTVNVAVGMYDMYSYLPIKFMALTYIYMVITENGNIPTEKLKLKLPVVCRS